MNFEKFTDRARQVMVEANAEALRGGGSVEPIDLLVGICKVEPCTAAQVLREMGCDLAATLGRVREMHAADANRAMAAPSLPAARAPLSKAVKTILGCAMTEAICNRHGYIGTEHILLGLAELRGHRGKDFSTPTQVSFLYHNVSKAVTTHLEKRLRVTPPAAPEEKGVVPESDEFGLWKVVERCRKALASPPLKLRVEGGGLPDFHEVEFEQAVLITRGDLDVLLGVATADRREREE